MFQSLNVDRKKLNLLPISLMRFCFLLLLFCNFHREKELWHNKILIPTAHQQQQQIHRNYLDVDKTESLLEHYDVSKREIRYFVESN